MTRKEFTYSEGLDKEWHTYGLYWSKDRIFTYFDDESNVVLDVDIT